MSHVKLTMLIVLLLVSLVGCSSNEQEDSLGLYFFADLPTTVSEDITNILIEGFPNTTEEDYLLSILPMYHEKIYAELAAKHGDIYFIKQDSVEGIIDPIGFLELDDLIKDTTFAEVDPEHYQTEHPDTNETHTYIIPVGNDSLLLKKLGLELNTPMAAFIPAYTENPEEAIQTLKYLIGE